MRFGPRRSTASIDALRCSYCGKRQARGRRVIRRENGFLICSECVDRVIAALAHGGTASHRRG